MENQKADYDCFELSEEFEELKDSDTIDCPFCHYFDSVDESCSLH